MTKSLPSPCILLNRRPTCAAASVSARGILRWSRRAVRRRRIGRPVGLRRHGGRVRLDELALVAARRKNEHRREEGQDSEYAHGGDLPERTGPNPGGATPPD